MPYFPYRQETVYRCPGCQRWFIPGNMSCLVAHAPGTCCHEYETETGQPQAKPLRAEL